MKKYDTHSSELLVTKSCFNSAAAINNDFSSYCASNSGLR